MAELRVRTVTRYLRVLFGESVEIELRRDYLGALDDCPCAMAFEVDRAAS